MHLRTALLTCLAVVLPTVTGAAAERVKSGPQVGEELPGTFKPRNVTGPDAGQLTCIFCEYGESPVAMVFARTPSAPLTRLLKRLDAETARHKAAGLASCVIFLSADEALPGQLQQLAEREKVQHTILRTFKPEGPQDYKLDPKADVTVVLFLDRVVKGNYAFAKGEMKDQDIAAIAAELAKMLPVKK
jgi:hypothetical protein